MSIVDPSVHSSAFSASTFDDDRPTLIMPGPVSLKRAPETIAETAVVGASNADYNHSGAGSELHELSSDTAGKPFIIIQINGKDGFRDNILMSPDDDPDEAAAQFIKKNQFPPEVMPKIVKLIEDQFDRNGITLRRRPQLPELAPNSTAKSDRNAFIGEPTNEVQLLTVNPRFVLKTRDDAGNKVFVNVCDHPFVDREFCVSIGSESVIVNEFGGKSLAFDVVCSVADVDRALMALSEQLSNDASARQVMPSFLCCSQRAISLMRVYSSCVILF
jgi:hypothetical protein